MDVVRVQPAEVRAAQPSSSNAATADPTRSASNSEVCWEVSSATYTCMWLGLFVLYVAVELYLVATIGAYVVVSLIPSSAFFADTFHVMPVRDYPPMLTLYSLVAVFYCVRISQFVYLSLRHRELVLPASLPPAQSSLRDSTHSPRCIQSCARGDAPATDSTDPKHTQRNQIDGVVCYVYEHLCSTHGFCGVRGVYFEAVVMLREVFEVVLQTVQAYLCSRQTAKFWVNATFAGLIVVNCFSSLLLHWVSKHVLGRGEHRAAVLVIDLALDVVWFAVIPTMTFAPYLISIFNNELVLSRDTFIVEGIMELPVFSITSYPDLFLKLWPPTAIYFTAKKIELLRDTRILARIERWLRLLLLCWGHAVLAVFIHANFVRSPACNAGCQLVLRPWLHAATDCDCAAFEIDCHALGITGTTSEIEQALTDANINPRGLMNLIIAHCPMLHVPSAIGMLRDLYGLVIFNCSLVSWHPDAWITSARHPNLGRVQLIHTFIPDVPQAILHANLPPRLLEIDIVASNLSSLPNDVAVFWSHLNTLLLDHGRFREFPSVLSRMPALETLSLYNNQITHIPDDALTGNTALHFFLVTLNPLQSLPSSLASCRELVDVWVPWTNVRDVSTPFAGSTARVLAHLNVYSWSSPACDDAAATAAPQWRICNERIFLYKGAVSYAFYPLAAKLEEKRPV